MKRENLPQLMVAWGCGLLFGVLSSVWDVDIWPATLLGIVAGIAGLAIGLMKE